MADHDNPGPKQGFWKGPAFEIYIWLGLIVGFGLVPFIFTIFNAALSEDTFSLPATIIHGELLVLSIALFGETLHELTHRFANRGQVDRFALSVVIACILALVCACLMLASVLEHDVVITKAMDKAIGIYSGAHHSSQDLEGALGGLKTSEDKLNGGLVIAASAVAFVMAVGAGIAIRWKGK